MVLTLKYSEKTCGYTFVSCKITLTMDIRSSGVSAFSSNVCKLFSIICKHRKSSLKIMSLMVSFLHRHLVLEKQLHV